VAELDAQAGRVARLALGLDEAAEALGCSRDYFDEHVRPEVRVVRRGRRTRLSPARASIARPTSCREGGWAQGEAARPPILSSSC